MDWKIIILFLIVTFNSYSQKIEDYTIFKDGEVYIIVKKKWFANLSNGN